MKTLNDLNGASKYLDVIAKNLMSEFDEPLYGCEMGIAYGGGVEKIGKLWKNRGTIYGFDTFEGHPKQLAELCEDTKAAGGIQAHATWCMDQWYKDKENFGTTRYKYNFIRRCLDEQSLDNVILVKGLITEETDISFIPKLHYVLLDLDFPISMKSAYKITKDKIVPGGYLCLHDVVPNGHIHGLHEFYQKVKNENMFDVVSEHPGSYLSILRRKN